MSENNVFWNYAVQIYSVEEIRDLCLTLQNRYQLSVNALLFALWLASKGQVLPWDLDDKKVREWREKILEPLRSLRYQLRQSKQSDDELNCYQELKKAELAAERVESGLLYDLSKCCPDATQTGDTGTQSDHAAEQSCIKGLGYLNLCTVAKVEPDMTGDLQTLLKQLENKAVLHGSN